MSHLTHDVLWSVAREPAPLDVQVHLASCDQCRAELETVKFAQGLLQEPPAPMPVLPEVSARRIGAVLRRAAEKQAEETQASSWWPFKWSPLWAFAPVAAALLAFAAYELTLPVEQQPAPLARNEPVVVPSAPVAPVPSPAPAPVLAKKLTASVTSSRNARSGAGQTTKLEKAQQLEEGSTVATSKGGALWMKLPDGSRAGLTGASQVQLAKLEEKAVTLDVTQGSLVVVARHDTSRELRVRAGDLEVIDVGTRFLVSKDDKRTLVAVEEGEVEVSAPGRRIPVHAGQAVEWRGGKLTQEAWAPMADEPKTASPPVGSKTAQVQAAPEDDTPPIAPLPAGESEKKKEPQPDVAQPATAVEAASSADEWATPENLKAVAANVPAAPASPAPEPAPLEQQQAAAATSGPSPTVEGGDEQADESFLQRVERKVKKFANGVVSATRSREDRAGDITRLSADGRTCTEAISRADLWLTESVPKGESFNLRKSVLRAKLHCLEYQGRTGDAAETRRVLQKL